MWNSHIVVKFAVGIGDDCSAPPIGRDKCSFLLLHFDVISDAVVVVAADYAARDKFLCAVVGTMRDDAISDAVVEAGQARELIARRGIDVDQLAALPAFANTFGSRFRVSFQFCRGICRVLADLIGTPAVPRAGDATE